jgi:hypothetical protein
MQMNKVFKVYFFGLIVLLFAGFKTDDDFKLCNPDKIYATKDYLYADTYFKDYEKVNHVPKYRGGIDSIQSFFDSTVVLTGDEARIIAKYHITFIVNCKGELGKFEYKSKPLPGYEKVLNACKKMPNWIPAQSHKQNVDCLMRLGFINRAGKITVEYLEK